MVFPLIVESIIIWEAGRSSAGYFFTMSQTPPAGYLNRKIAESVQDAIAHYSVDNIKTIVKSAIQRYIQSFMDTEGGNRELFESFTKMGVQYITDKSFNPASDPTLRKTQLARLFEQVKQDLPCILIMDSAFDFVNSNWTGLDKVWIKNYEWHGRVHIARNLRILVVAGTRDQSSTDFLHGLLSILFGEMRFLAGGTRMAGNKLNGETWVMTLGNPILGKVSQNKVNGDAKDAVWFFDIEVPDILFEDYVVIKQPFYRVEPGTGVMNPPGFLGDTPPVILFPDTIPINEPTELLIDLFQPDYQTVFISDPNIAVYEPQSQIVTGRRLGTFQIQIMRPRRDVDKSPVNEQNGNTLEIVASQEVRVTPI